MAVTVKRATLWTTHTSNTPGSLAASLSPLAEGNVNLDLVMGYSHPDKAGATIEVFPVEGNGAQRSARRAGYQKSGFPCVWIMGQNRIGLGRQIASALAEAGININFFIAQVVRREYVGMFSFEANSEADLAVKIIREAVKHKPLAVTRSRTTKAASKKKKSATTRASRSASARPAKKSTKTSRAAGTKKKTKTKTRSRAKA